MVHDPCPSVDTIFYIVRLYVRSGTDVRSDIYEWPTWPARPTQIPCKFKKNIALFMERNKYQHFVMDA